MQSKFLSKETLSYFLKFFFLAVSLFLLGFALISLTNSLVLVFDETEKRLAVYKSILLEKSEISSFLMAKGYDVFGSRAFGFIVSTTNVSKLFHYEHISSFFTYFYFAYIFFLIFLILKDFSFSKKPTKLLIILGVSLIITPLLNILKDYIGLLLVNSYLFDGKIINLGKINFIYPLIGSLIISSSLEKNKFNNYLNYMIYLLFFIIFSIETFNNIKSLVINLNLDNYEYRNLVRESHEFIYVIKSLGFDIFGNKWTNIGLNLNLKIPLIIYYFKCLFFFLSLALISLNHAFKRNIKFSAISLIIILILNILIDLIICIVILKLRLNLTFVNSDFNYNFFNIINIIIIFIPLLLIINSMKTKTA